MNGLITKPDQFFRCDIVGDGGSSDAESEEMHKQIILLVERDICNTKFGNIAYYILKYIISSSI